MFKPIHIIGIAVFFILGLFSSCFSEESMTITTYYPSPYGSYRQLSVENPSTGSDLVVPLSVQNLRDAANNNGLNINIARTGTNTDAYALNVQSGGTSRLFVRSDGRVGIGTTGPGAKLGIGSLGSLWTTGGWDKAVEIPNAAVLKWQRNAGNWRHGIGQTDNGLYFGMAQVDDNSGAITYNMFIGDSGNVGIGTTSPGSYKLACNGQPGANGYTAWTNYSDRRLKENIKGIEDGILEKIMRLKPSTFNYNERYFKVTGYSKDKDNRKLCGFAAQEIREVFPEMVNERKLSGEIYLDTNLTNLQVYLVKAIQEQQKHISELELEIKDLKTQLKKIK